MQKSSHCVCVVVVSMFVVCKQLVGVYLVAGQLRE